VADGVLLLIEHLLLAFGDMAAVEFGHVTLLLANRVVFPVKRVGLLLISPSFSSRSIRRFWFASRSLT
jgi:hypothetical protein